MPREAEPSINERAFVLQALRENLRIDGRAFDAFRHLELSFGDELGVADVKLGKTRYNRVSHLHVDFTIDSSWPELSPTSLPKYHNLSPTANSTASSPLPPSSRPWPPLPSKLEGTSGISLPPLHTLRQCLFPNYSILTATKTPDKQTKKPSYLASLRKPSAAQTPSIPNPSASLLVGNAGTCARTSTFSTTTAGS